MTSPLTPSEYELRSLNAADLPLIAQVDRSETNVADYVAAVSDDGLGLRLERVPIDPPSRIPAWGGAGVQARVHGWQPEVEAGGCFVGAFRGARLCGFGVLGPVKSDGSVELHALFVDAGCRRSGVGVLLLRELERLASERGARSMWCASNRTASAVQFYLKHGYRPISLNSNALVSHRVGDPVLAKPLGAPSGG